MPIGPSVVITGELSASEDLTVEGTVEGTVQLRQNVLTVGPHGNLKARVFARTVVVLGKVTGDITASEKVDIREGGSVHGDVVAPRVAIADGGDFRGSVDMQTKNAQPIRNPSRTTPDQRAASGDSGQGKPQVATAAH